MKKKIILVDMDGVLCNFIKYYLKKIFSRGGPLLSESEIKHFEIRDNFEKKYHELMRGIDGKKNFYLNLEPIDGAIESLKKMFSDKRLEIFICTSPKKIHNFCVQEKYDWVKKHLGQEFVEKIIMTRDKTLIHGNFLIDDKVEITGKNKNPTWEHLLFDRTYNQHVSSKKRFFWENWEEIIFSK
jgi:5'-nucleotidase